MPQQDNTSADSKDTGLPILRLRLHDLKFIKGETNHMFISDDIKSCPLYYAISIIGGKWQALILWHLSTSPVKRYGELKRCIPFEVSHKSFTQQLKELEDDGLIIRKQYNEVPPRVEYSLTQRGREVIPIIYALRDWGAKWGDFPPDIKYQIVNKIWNGC